MTKLARFVPALLQLLGAFALAFAIGGLAGWWYACGAMGVGMLASGTLAEIAQRKAN